jgi:hypothetical protein
MCEISQHFAPKMYDTGQNVDLIRILKTKSLTFISLNDLGYIYTKSTFCALLLEFTQRNTRIGKTKSSIYLGINIRYRFELCVKDSNI